MISYSPKQAAPGKVSITADTWTADNTKVGYLGATAQWIEVKNGLWKLRSEVIGFQAISGDHSGLNLGRYLIGICDCVGITGEKHSKVQFPCQSQRDLDLIIPDASCTLQHLIMPVITIPPVKQPRIFMSDEGWTPGMLRRISYREL